VEVLRQIMVQNFLVDARGRLRPRAEKDGLAPARVRIESPYDLQAHGFAAATGAGPVTSPTSPKPATRRASM
jgi:hypothetical protein